MKNTIKFLGIIALVAIIGFSMVSCNNDSDGGGGVEKSGTLSPDADGKIYFEINFSGTSGTCIVTTDLPAPNNKFELDRGNNTKEIVIPADSGYNKIKWTAKVEGGNLNYTSTLSHVYISWYAGSYLNM